jgi:small basic protein (TIGR04137 family)
MSVDKTLKSKSSLARHRNVLKRPERITKLQELGRWTDESSVIGMPKVGNRKAAIGKKTKKKKDEGEEDKK